MATLFGDMTLRDILGATSTLQQNLGAYEDRERQKRLDKEASKRADERLSMDKENHELEMEAKRRTLKLMKMQDAYGKAKAANKAGREKEMFEHLNTIQSLRTDGVDALKSVDMRRFSQEDKQDFFARNPEMRDLQGNDIVVQTFNRMNDRIEYSGFKNKNQMLDYFKNIVNPQQLIQDEASTKAFVDEKRREAMPVAAVTQKGDVKYYIDMPFIDDDGHAEMRRTELSPEDAKKYDASIIEKGELLKEQRNMAKGAAELEMATKEVELARKGLDLQKVGMELKKLQEVPEEAEYKPSKEEQAEAYKWLEDRLMPRGRSDVMSEVDVEQAQKEVDRRAPFLARALTLTNGDIGAAVREAENLADYADYVKAQQLEKAANARKEKAEKRTEKVLEEREEERRRRRERSKNAAEFSRGAMPY